jgi:Ketosteroid isomerase homolog
MKAPFFIVGSLVATIVLMSGCGPPATNVISTNKPANSVSTSNTNTAASSASDDADIKKRMADIAAALAKNDPDAAGKFYSDDYHLVTPDGVDQTKTMRIADMRSGATKFESFAYDNVNVRTYGDMAVAIATVKAKGTVSGKPRTTDMRATLVFRKMEDGWKVVSGQATPIAAAGATTPPGNNASATKPAMANSSTNANK